MNQGLCNDSFLRTSGQECPDSPVLAGLAWTAEDVAEIKRNLERKVKLFSLIKGVVIIAASHLFESELAREFVTENPVVLKEGMVLPALNCNYNNFDDFLTAKREGSKERKLYLGNDH